MGLEVILTPLIRELPEARHKHIEILEQCSKWIDEGLLKTHISHQFPLKEAAKAHDLIEEGHTSGKIVLSIED